MTSRVQLSEAEQNQLVLEHRHLAEVIAAKYARWKNLEFEELAAEGRVGLVRAVLLDQAAERPVKRERNSSAENGHSSSKSIPLQ